MKKNNILEEIIIDDDIDQPFFPFFMQETEANIVWQGENVPFVIGWDKEKLLNLLSSYHIREEKEMRRGKQNGKYKQ